MSNATGSVLRSFLILGMGLAACLSLSTATFAQDSSGKPAQLDKAPTVIHVHHHFYFPFADDPSGGDPAARFSPYEYSFERSSFDAVPALNNNWGGLGLFGFMGKQDGKAGMIVTRITPDSPAAKLGLVKGDIIIKINDLNMNDLSYSDMEALFVRLSSTPKIGVTMQVWNYHTRRGETLKGVLENDTDDGN